jgi:hypothetical protein
MSMLVRFLGPPHLIAKKFFSPPQTMMSKEIILQVFRGSFGWFGRGASISRLEARLYF